MTMEYALREQLLKLANELDEISNSIYQLTSCKHEYEEIGVKKIFDYNQTRKPSLWGVYQCKKCRHIEQMKL